MPKKAKPSLRVDVLTLFPGMFAGPLSESLIGRAREAKVLDLRIHNLRDWARGQGAPAPYAREFQGWVFDRLAERDIEALVDYRSRSPHGVRAHPTDEHFLPLFFALGAAAGKAKPERVYDAIDAGVLAMDAYVFA